MNKVSATERSVDLVLHVFKSVEGHIEVSQKVFLLEFSSAKSLSQIFDTIKLPR